jgi:hypothetical protein
MADDGHAILRNRFAASAADAERAGGDARQRRLDHADIALPCGPEAFERLVALALSRAFFNIGVAGLLKLGLGRGEARAQFHEAGVQDGFVMHDVGPIGSFVHIVAPDCATPSKRRRRVGAMMYVTPLSL